MGRHYVHVSLYVCIENFNHNHLLVIKNPASLMLQFGIGRHMLVRIVW